jgi:glycosyltransferase involved in cell wall biosynthesis
MIYVDNFSILTNILRIFIQKCLLVLTEKIKRKTLKQELNCKTNIDVLIICSYLSKTDAAFRRISYLVKYLKSKNLRIACVGFLRLTNNGIVKPSGECYSLPLSISTRNFMINLLNIILSFPLVVFISIIHPKIVFVSIPDSYMVLASYLGCILTKAKHIVDVRDPLEEILAWTYRKGYLGFVSKTYKRINYAIYKKSHAVVGVTRTLVSVLTKQLDKKVFFAPNGADLEIFKPIDKSIARKTLGLGQNSFLIAYTGFIWLYGYYNLLPALLAIRRVRRLGIDIRLVAAGPILDYLTGKIISKFKEEVIYLGSLDVNGIIKLLSACDIGLIPLVEDIIFCDVVPVKFYEYVAAGLPSLVTANKRGELARIVNQNELGFLCGSKDLACIEKALMQLAKNDYLMNRLRNNTFMFRKCIDRKIGAETLFQIITQLLHN